MTSNIMRRKETKPATSLSNWGIKTILDESVVLDGNLQTQSSVLFKGEITGMLTVNSPGGVAIVSSSAKIKGGVVAESIVVFGEVSGPIVCRDIRFMNGSIYDGALQYQNIKIDTGSVVNASPMFCKDFDLAEVKNV